MDRASKSLKEILNEESVNSKYRSNVSNTVNSNRNRNTTLTDKISAFIERENITPEGVAQKLCEDLDDEKSHYYFLLLAKNNNCGRLLEALSITKDAYLRGRIRTKKAIYFMGIIKRWGLKTKFKEKHE